MIGAMPMSIIKVNSLVIIRKFNTYGRSIYFFIFSDEKILSEINLIEFSFKNASRYFSHYIKNTYYKSES